MLRNLIRLSASGKPIYGTPDIGIDASQIIAETATGDQGPGLLYDDALANTGTQLRVKITSWSGTPGTLFVYENSSILVDISQADGSFVIGYDREAWASDGSVATISDTATVTIGPVNASVAAGEGVGTGSGTGGDAVGVVAGSGIDAGGAGTSTGSGSGGIASGGGSFSGSLSPADIVAIGDEVWGRFIGSMAASVLIERIYAIIAHKMITDPASGTITVYAEDDTTPMLTADIFKDASGTTPYNGTGAERRERLT